MISFSFGQFARLLSISQSKWEREINRIFERERAPKMKRMPPHYAAARGVIRRLVAGAVTKSAACHLSHSMRSEAEELRVSAKKVSRSTSQDSLRESKRLLRRAGKLLDNSTMVDKFVTNFDLTGVTAMGGVAFNQTISTVELRIAPDLCFRRNGRAQFVKLSLTKDLRKADGARIRATLRKLMFNAIFMKEKVVPRDVYVFNVLTGEVLEGKLVDTELQVAMKALALAIERVHAERDAAGAGAGAEHVSLRLCRNVDEQRTLRRRSFV